MKSRSDVLTWEGDPNLLVDNLAKWDYVPGETSYVGGKWGGINKRGRGGVTMTTKYRVALDSMVDAFKAQWSVAPMKTPVLLVVESYWPALHRVGDLEGQPVGSASDAVSPIKLALKWAGVLAHPHHNSSLVATALYDHQRPRIEVEVKPWEK